MDTAAPANPLTALVWVFAACTAVLVILFIATGILAARHRYRRRRGVYLEALRDLVESSRQQERGPVSVMSAIAHILTVGDLVMDRALQEAAVTLGQQLAPHTGRPPEASELTRDD